MLTRVNRLMELWAPKRALNIWTALEEGLRSFTCLMMTLKLLSYSEKRIIFAYKLNESTVLCLEMKYKSALLRPLHLKSLKLFTFKTICTKYQTHAVGAVCIQGQNRVSNFLITLFNRLWQFL
jgi:hypothetical protein